MVDNQKANMRQSASIILHAYIAETFEKNKQTKKKRIHDLRQLSGMERCKSAQNCRIWSGNMLQISSRHIYLQRIGYDTVEKEPRQICCMIALSRERGEHPFFSVVGTQFAVSPWRTLRAYTLVRPVRRPVFEYINTDACDRGPISASQHFHRDDGYINRCFLKVPPNVFFVAGKIVRDS